MEYKVGSGLTKQDVVFLFVINLYLQMDLKMTSWSVIVSSFQLYHVNNGGDRPIQLLSTCNSRFWSFTRTSISFKDLPLLYGNYSSLHKVFIYTPNQNHSHVTKSWQLIVIIPVHSPGLVVLLANRTLRSMLNEFAKQKGLWRVLWPWQNKSAGSY